MGKRVFAIVLIVLGALVFLGCVITGGVILSIAPKRLAKTAQIPIYGEKPYSAFVDSRDSDAPALYYEYYLYDLQNFEEIGAAATFADIPTPVVQKKGPYTYREYCTRHNLYYRDDGATANIAVDFNELCYKEFVPSLSIASDGRQNRESDVVTLPYYQYYGVARTAGILSTPNVPMMMATGVLYSTIFNSVGLLGEQFVAGKMFAAPMDNSECNLKALDAIFKCSLARLAYGSTNGKTVTNFDLELSMPKELYPASTDASYVSTFNKLMFCKEGTTCHSIRMSNCANPGVEAPLLPCLAYFLGVMKQHVANPTDETLQYILHTYWGFSDFGETASIRASFFAKFLQNGAGKFFEKAFEAAGAGYTPEDYGSLTANHMFARKSARNQILGQAVDAYSAQLGATDTIGSLFSYLDCPETFKTHGPDNSASLNYNACLAEWNTRSQSKDRYGQKTGRNNINDVEEVTMWRSLDHMPKRDPVTRSGFWKAGDVKLVGRRNPNFPSASNHMTKWEMNPVVNEHYKAVLYNADTLRDVSFLYNKKSSVHGVKTLQFIPDMANVDPRLAASHFEVSEYGVFDLTTPKGVPIHLTFCNYMHASWNGNPNIKKPVLDTPDAERDTVMLEVEPLTGKTIKAKFQLLVNLKVPAGSPGISGGVVDPTGKQFVVYPLLTMNKHSSLTESNAKDLRKAQSLLNDAPKPLIIVGCVVGPILILLGIVLLVRVKSASEMDGQNSDFYSHPESSHPYFMINSGSSQNLTR